MRSEIAAGWTQKPLTPFGAAVMAGGRGAALTSLSWNTLQELVNEHRVVVARGFAPLAGAEWPEFCGQLGEIQEWDFGAVNELRVQPDAKNYLYTNRAVPFHWDGAFAGRIPHYILFHCDAAPPPDAGGATLFCDTARLYAHATPAQREQWASLSVTYTTEKLAHYGGSFTANLLAQHPFTRETVLRYAEPVHDLNPVRWEIHGLPAIGRDSFLAEMRELLYDPRFCYAHQWQDGDVLIADNHALLHGRRAFDAAAPRRIRRVNIM